MNKCVTGNKRGATAAGNSLKRVRNASNVRTPSTARSQDPD
jgi:hypothetical protein